MNHLELTELMKTIGGAYDRIDHCINHDDNWGDEDEHYDCLEDLRFIAGHINKALEGSK